MLGIAKSIIIEIISIVKKQVQEISFLFCNSPNNPPKNFQGEDVFAPLVSTILDLCFKRIYKML
jgi:hypothetical protein